jgi:hypothetical protein
MEKYNLEKIKPHSDAYAVRRWFYHSTGDSRLQNTPALAQFWWDISEELMQTKLILNKNRHYWPEEGSRNSTLKYARKYYFQKGIEFEPGNNISEHTKIRLIKKMTLIVNRRRE